MPRKLKKLSLTEQHRFWSKVDIPPEPQACWKWKASLNDKGYGRFGVRGTEYKAHRLAFFLFHNQIKHSLLVLHKCDNPSCCNPTHLFQGDAGTNARDAVRKKRHTRLFGEQNGKVKLSAANVDSSRQMRNAGASIKSLAERYTVAQSTISYICRGLRRIEQPDRVSAPTPTLGFPTDLA